MPSAFAKALLTLKSVDLKSIARLCGSATTGTKSALAETLETTVQARTRNLLQNCRLVSIDLGIENIGVCQVLVPPWSKNAMQDLGAPKPIVERWFHHSLPQPFQHKFPAFADNVVEFSQMFAPSADTVYNVFLLEQQRSRTASSRAIPNSILRVNIMEGMMFAALRLQHASSTTVLQSISPRSVVDFWRSALQDTTGIQAPAKIKASEKTSAVTPGQMYRLAKRTRATLVQRWQADPDNSPFMFQHHGQAPSKSVEPSGSGGGRKKTKIDDVNDALVQAYTWVLWRHNCAQLQINAASGGDLSHGLYAP